MSDDEPWFRAKLHGYGAGLPIHWKGWVLTAFYVAAIVGSPAILEWYLGYPPPFLHRLVFVVALTAPFLWIVKRKTKGGWRWRHGEEEQP
jgi:hypothetical protein